MGLGERTMRDTSARAVGAGASCPADGVGQANLEVAMSTNDNGEEVQAQEEAQAQVSR